MDGWNGEPVKARAADRRAQRGRHIQTGPLPNPDLLTEEEDPHCVKGCYRCLLSYYNQPDHDLIDRTDSAALALLLRLARSELQDNGRAKGPSEDAGNARSDGNWHAAIAQWGLPAPDRDPLPIGSSMLPLAWRAHLVAATIGPVNPETRAAAEALGFGVAALPEVPGETPPAELVELLGENA